MGKFPGNKMEAISVGPTVRNPHTVDEGTLFNVFFFCLSILVLEVPSACQLYEFLKQLVEALSK